MPGRFWTDYRLSFLAERWTVNASASSIAAELKTTRGAVLGAVHRYLTPDERQRHPGDRARERPRKAKPRRAAPAPVIRLFPPKPKPLPVSGPAGGVLLIELVAGACRWPVGVNADGATVFCGATGCEGSYCSPHAATAAEPERKASHGSTTQARHGQRGQYSRWTGAFVRP